MSPLAPDTLKGLPGPLPPGEHALWQGSPRWTTLARRALHLPLLAAYFAGLALWQAWEGAAGGASAAEIGATLARTAALAGAVLGFCALYAWWAARSTVYTVTTARVVMTFGIALPVTLNIPFRSIASAAVKVAPDGTGDIPLASGERRRLSYLVLWPHVRPWRLGRVEPMLRAIPDVQAVADALGLALVQAQALRRDADPARAPQAAPEAPAQMPAQASAPAPAAAPEPATHDGRLRPAAA